MKKNSVHAVYVTYQPDLEVLDNSLKNLQSQVSAITLVDNNSLNILGIRALSEKYPTLTVISLPSNYGLGKAQNTGIKHAISKEASQILLMDQDSIFQHGAVAKLSLNLLHLGSNCKVAAVGPQYTLDNKIATPPFVRCYWFYLGRVSKRELEANPAVETDFLISSGTLIETKALRTIGLMDEELFIDHVDTEWCLRARSHDYRLYGIRDAHMQHSLGERTYRIWLGRWRNLPQHKAFRYYFTYRNSLLLARRPYTPIKWCTADFSRLVVMAIFCLLTPGQRLQSIWMAMRGIADGIRGRSSMHDFDT